MSFVLCPCDFHCKLRFCVRVCDTVYYIFYSLNNANKDNLVDGTFEIPKPKKKKKKKQKNKNKVTSTASATQQSTQPPAFQPLPFLTKTLPVATLQQRQMGPSRFTYTYASPQSSQLPTNNNNPNSNGKVFLFCVSFSVFQLCKVDNVMF